MKKEMKDKEIKNKKSPTSCSWRLRNLFKKEKDRQELT